MIKLLPKKPFSGGIVFFWGTGLLKSGRGKLLELLFSKDVCGGSSLSLLDMLFTSFPKTNEGSNDIIKYDMTKTITNNVHLFLI
ncbi:hypothetical protein NBRC110019_14920 [Neptunitalea chrysea]|uniref:Uncharacterized protein n=1 Tax=Neptunitalea chrysea TaxID=1647581 RepID=A0A9W6B708_9FLAO|nr:hypothetical protein NBRC110019_14920 [Neptunitalea chrysea]